MPETTRTLPSMRTSTSHPFSRESLTAETQAEGAGEAFSLGILLGEEDNKLRFLQRPSGLPLVPVFHFSPSYLSFSHSLNNSYTPGTEPQWLCHLKGRTCRHKGGKGTFFFKNISISLADFPLSIPNPLSSITLVYSSLQSLPSS